MVYSYSLCHIRPVGLLLWATIMVDNNTKLTSKTNPKFPQATANIINTSSKKRQKQKQIEKNRPNQTKLSCNIQYRAVTHHTTVNKVPYQRTSSNQKCEIVLLSSSDVDHQNVVHKLLQYKMRHVYQPELFLHGNQ